MRRVAAKRLQHTVYVARDGRDLQVHHGVAEYRPRRLRYWWLTNRHRVYPGHLFVRRIQRQSAVSEHAFIHVRSFSNELYLKVRQLG